MLLGEPPPALFTAMTWYSNSMPGFWSLSRTSLSTTARPPIIDMHLHGGFEAGKFVTEPDGTPLPRPCFPERCSHSPARVQMESEILPLTLEAMRQHKRTGT